MNICSKMLLRGLLSLVFFLPGGVCSAQSQAITMSFEDLTILEEHCKAQEIALEQSLTALEEARELLTDLGQELTDSAQELTESQASLAELKRELSAHKVELAKLKLELSRLKTESAQLSDTLKKANQSLNDTEAVYKKESKKTKRQTRIWQVIAVILGGVAAAK